MGCAVPCPRARFPLTSAMPHIALPLIMVLRTSGDNTGPGAKVAPRRRRGTGMARAACLDLWTVPPGPSGRDVKVGTRA